MELGKISLEREKSKKEKIEKFSERRNRGGKEGIGLVNRIKSGGQKEGKNQKLCGNGYYVWTRARPPRLNKTTISRTATTPADSPAEEEKAHKG